MLTKAATNIKLPIKADPFVPIRIIIFNAILLCSPEASIPRAKIKPPKNKYIFLSANGAAVSWKVDIPKIGNNARGIKAVTATGIASVAHQIAINNRIAKTNHADWLLT